MTAKAVSALVALVVLAIAATVLQYTGGPLGLAVGSAVWGYLIGMFVGIAITRPEVKS